MTVFDAIVVANVICIIANAYSFWRNQRGLDKILKLRIDALDGIQKVSKELAKVFAMKRYLKERYGIETVDMTIEGEEGFALRDLRDSQDGPPNPRDRLN